MSPVMEMWPTFSSPFENDNAKYLNPSDIARTFIATEDFWRLFSEKNHVIFGTRGSGKTALGRMVSHDHLALLNHPKADQYIEDKRYIGIYAPARLNWVSGLRSQLLLQAGSERDYFILRFNFVVARAFLVSLRSCLERYVTPESRPDAEYALVKSVLNVWSGSVPPPMDIYTLKGLGKEIAACDFRLQRWTTRSFYRNDELAISPFDRELLTTFGTNLVEPITVLRDVAQESLDLPEYTKYILAIDEMEFLSEEHQVILNGLLRADTPGFVFKFITAPYCHYSLATETNAPLIEGNDYENVYIDHGRYLDAHTRNELQQEFGRPISFQIALFLKRATASGITVTSDTLGGLLGASEVLEPLPVNQETIRAFRPKVLNHANHKTITRFEELWTRLFRSHNAKEQRETVRKISDEVVRKIKPAIVLREKIAGLAGAKKGTAYSGLNMVLACTESNPRVLIRTLNMLFPNLSQAVHARSIVSQIAQDESLSTLSQRFLDNALAVPEVGPDLHRMIKALGEHFRSKLHMGRVGTDTVGSIEVTESDGDILRLIKQAVAWGFMYPHFKDEKRDVLPTTSGEFRLAYILAPHFQLLPRRGRPIRPSTVFPQISLRF